MLFVCTASGVAETPKTDDDLIEMLINIADTIESEAAVPNRSYLYTRPVCKLLCSFNNIVLFNNTIIASCLYYCVFKSLCCINYITISTLHIRVSI